MSKVGKYIYRIINILVISYVANMYVFYKSFDIGIGKKILLGIVTSIYFLFIQIIPSFYQQKKIKRRIRICANGCELLICFICSSVVLVTVLVYGLFTKKLEFFNRSKLDIAIFIIIAVVLEAIVFWNGIIRVYTTSVQLGMKYRVIGIACGLIPIAHLIALFAIIKRVLKEVEFENDKDILNRNRSSMKICHTKYPILMVHGVFFRDFKYFNYWGRIPNELIENGAKVYYGNHQSALSVEDSAKELLARVKEICEKEKCDKVNIIAHSKGGLDCRYMIEHLEAGKYVASLTTINTPHRGCKFAKYLLWKIPKSQQQMIEKAYNTALKKMGDESPDFMSAVNDLTDEACINRNNLAFDNSVYDNILCQSVGSKLNKALAGKFPLNFSQPLVKHFDGENDGLVGSESFKWGSKYTYLTVNGKRGISHGDVIDLNRENIDGFDVREFYVSLVADLKDRQL